MYRETGDSKATAARLMHSEKSQMADRYTLGGVDAPLRVAVRALNQGTSRTVSAGTSG
jgi:hypothetical protein